MVPLAAIAAVAVLVSLLYWRRTEAAGTAEEDALAEAGAQSYLGFHLQRVNGLLSSDPGASDLITAAEEHRDAAQPLARAGRRDRRGVGAVQPRRHHRRRRLREQRSDPGRHPRRPDPPRRPRPAHAVRSRLTELRPRGPGRESFPALLDEPVRAPSTPGRCRPCWSSWSTRPSTSRSLLLTGSPAVASWARVEAMTGGDRDHRAHAGGRPASPALAPPGGPDDPSTGDPGRPVPWPACTSEPATVDDAAAILEIYNHEVADVDGHVRPRAPHAGRAAHWIPDRSGAHAVLVAVDDDGTVPGFGALSAYRERAGVRHHGRGLGVRAP